MCGDLDLSLQLAKCQQKEKVARHALDACRALIHQRWPHETKVVVAGEGSVTLGKKPAGSVRTSYSCDGGEATFKAALSDEEQRRFKHVFTRPDARLLVRDDGGAGRMRTTNKSGRALTVSTGGGAGGGGTARLPSTAFASRA